jgi:hypothetical protein
MLVKIKDEWVRITFDTYKNNGRLAVVLESLDGGAFATLSCNLPDCDKILEGEFAVKVWSESEEIARACHHLFEDTGKIVQAGYCLSPIWRRRTSFVIMRVGPALMSDRVKRPIATFLTRESAEEFIKRRRDHSMEVVEVEFEP